MRGNYKFSFILFGLLTACDYDGVSSETPSVTDGLAADLEAVGVVRIENGPFQSCGVTLVTPSQALTAGHCTDSKQWFEKHLEEADALMQRGETEKEARAYAASAIISDGKTQGSNTTVHSKIFLGWETTADIAADKFHYRRSHKHAVHQKFFLTPEAETCFSEQESNADFLWCLDLLTGYDFAVLQLDNQPAGTDEVTPLPIAPQEIFAEDLIEGATVIMPAYGKDNAEKRRIATFTVSMTACQERHDCNPETQFVIVGQGKSEICKGDSGSPMLLTTDDASYVVGVVSRQGDEYAELGDGVKCSPLGIAGRTDALNPL